MPMILGVAGPPGRDISPSAGRRVRRRERGRKSQPAALEMTARGKAGRREKRRRGAALQKNKEGRESFEAQDKESRAYKGEMPS